MPCCEIFADTDTDTVLCVGDTIRRAILDSTNKRVLHFNFRSVVPPLCYTISLRTCVRTKIKAKDFSGQVFAVFELRPNDKEPFPQATIKLLKRTDDGDKFIAEVIADGDGRFSLENVKFG